MSPDIINIYSYKSIFYLHNGNHLHFINVSDYTSFSSCLIFSSFFFPFDIKLASLGLLSLHSKALIQIPFFAKIKWVFVEIKISMNVDRIDTRHWHIVDWILLDGRNLSWACYYGFVLHYLKVFLYLKIRRLTSNSH